MALNFGFYNSLSGDRVYNASDMSSFFKGILVDGILDGVGTKLVPVAYSGMTLKVGIGKAWFNETWTDNTTDYQITHDAAHPTLNRIDVIVLEVDTSLAVRANAITIVKGTAASNPTAPTLTNTSTQHQYPLAHVAVDAGVTEIVSGKITSKVGTVDTPYAVVGKDKTLQTDIDTINTNLTNAKYDRVRIEIVVLTNNDILAVKDGVGDFEFTVPAELTGWNLVDAQAAVFTVSSSGLPTFQIRNVTDAVDMLSTKITIDVSEYNSYSAATQRVIDGTKDDVATGDRLRFDCDVTGTGTKGFAIIMIFQKP